MYKVDRMYKLDQIYVINEWFILKKLTMLHIIKKMIHTYIQKKDQKIF